jgi:hypothetical protein
MCPQRRRETMAEHTPTPWRVEKGTGLVWGDCTLFDDGTPDRLGVPVADGQLERPWAQGKGPSYEEMEANAAFIVKSVNSHDALIDALRAFVVHATYPVSTEINPRGYAWRGEDALDHAKSLADVVLDAVGGVAK